MAILGLVTFRWFVRFRQIKAIGQAYDAAVNRAIAAGVFATAEESKAANSSGITPQRVTANKRLLPRPQSMNRFMDPFIAAPEKWQFAQFSKSSKVLDRFVDTVPKVDGTEPDVPTTGPQFEPGFLFQTLSMSVILRDCELGISAKTWSDFDSVATWINAFAMSGTEGTSTSSVRTYLERGCEYLCLLPNASRSDFDAADKILVKLEIGMSPKASFRGQVQILIHQIANGDYKALDDGCSTAVATDFPKLPSDVQAQAIGTTILNQASAIAPSLDSADQFSTAVTRFNKGLMQAQVGEGKGQTFSACHLMIYSDFAIQLANIRILREVLSAVLTKRTLGDYPQSLPITSAGGNDPFLPGKLLQYRREGAGFSVYSVGPDGLDQGGNRLLDIVQTVPVKPLLNFR